MKLAIAIPTRDRPQSLGRLLDSIGGQTMLPDRIVIVDDNHQAGQVALPRLGAPVDVIHGMRRGPAWAHQAALEFVSRPGNGEPPELVLRLDDDLVLESRDFVERLCRVMDPDCRTGQTSLTGQMAKPALRAATAAFGLAAGPTVGAAGGVYPQANNDALVVIERLGGPGYSLTIAGMLRGEDSAQFYRWDRARLVEAEHLYSSFVYRREAALAIGGFATCYSAQAHREETDFTYRLHRAGWKLMVDTGAVARHERCAHGGLRAVARDELRRADEAVFLERLVAQESSHFESRTSAVRGASRADQEIGPYPMQCAP